MIPLPKNVNQISTYRNYMIVQQAPHNDNFPFPFYRIYSLETEREIYMPLIGGGIGWRYMKVHESGLLFETQVPNKTNPNCQCFFTNSGNFLSYKDNCIFTSITDKKNIIIAEVTEKDGSKYCFYFGVTGLLVAYTLQKSDEKEFHLYDGHDKEILFRNDSLDFYQFTLVENCETEDVSGLQLQNKKRTIFYPFEL